MIKKILIVCASLFLLVACGGAEVEETPEVVQEKVPRQLNVQSFPVRTAGLGDDLKPLIKSQYAGAGALCFAPSSFEGFSMKEVAQVPAGSLRPTVNRNVVPDTEYYVYVTLENGQRVNYQDVPKEENGRVDNFEPVYEYNPNYVPPQQQVTTVSYFEPVYSQPPNQPQGQKENVTYQQFLGVEYSPEKGYVESVRVQDFENVKEGYVEKFHNPTLPLQGYIETVAR